MRATCLNTRLVPGQTHTRPEVREQQVLDLVTDMLVTHTNLTKHASPPCRKTHVADRFMRTAHMHPVRCGATRRAHTTPADLSPLAPPSWPRRCPTSDSNSHRRHPVRPSRWSANTADRRRGYGGAMPPPPARHRSCTT